MLWLESSWVLCLDRLFSDPVLLFPGIELVVHTILNLHDNFMSAVLLVFAFCSPLFVLQPSHDGEFDSHGFSWESFIHMVSLLCGSIVCWSLMRSKMHCLFRWWLHVLQCIAQLCAFVDDFWMIFDLGITWSCTLYSRQHLPIKYPRSWTCNCNSFCCSSW